MKTFIKILVLMIAVFQINSVMAAENIIGTWQGDLVIAPGSELTIQFIITQEQDDSYSVILYSPDQGAIKNIRADSAVYSSGVLKVDVTELSGSYEGTVKDGKIEGKWKQEGTSFPLNLSPFQKREITQKDIDEAVSTANKWKELIDNQKYNEAYAFWHKNVKVTMTEDQFTEQQKIMRDSQGKTLSRKKYSTEYMDSAGGITSGDHVSIEYEVTFEKEALNETIIMTLEEDGWKVSGNFFLPLDSPMLKRNRPDEGESQKQ